VVAVPVPAATTAAAAAAAQPDGSRLYVDGQYYVNSPESSHAHVMMAGQGKRYLPDRAEYIIIAVVTLSVVAFFLFQLQIITCCRRQGGRVGGRSD
jgi:hypothetical protein